MKILISPYAKQMRDGNPHPKNYPYWQQLVDLLIKDGHSIIQIGVKGETELKGIRGFFPDLSLKAIEELVRSQDLWISIDTFLPHLCNAQKVNTKGVVIFSHSDPRIYGYFQNLNVLKDRKYLRPDQFHIWEQCKRNEDAYIEPEKILDMIHNAKT